MKGAPFFKLFAKILVGPLAGAFGLWLLTEAPAVHAAICAPVF